MATLFVSIGISGSGKTTFGEKLKKYINLAVVCPLDIRKRLTGNISDLSQDDKVFSITVYTITKFLKNNCNVYYSATNLTKKSRSFLFDIQKKVNCRIVFIIMTDSYNLRLCSDRVKKDLEQKIDRLNTLVCNSEGKQIIYTQYLKFRNCSIVKEVSTHANTFCFQTGNKYLFSYLKKFENKKSIMNRVENKKSIMNRVENFIYNIFR